MRTSPVPAPTRAALLLSALVACFAAAPGRAEQSTTPRPVPEEIQQLVRDLGDNRFPVRQRATDRLRAVGLDALPALQEVARSNDPEVRQRVWKLIDGWAAEGKIPALLAQLNSPHGGTRAEAAETLGKLGSAARPAVAALTKAVRDDSEVVRCSAREALKNIQAAPELTVEVQCLDDNVKVGESKRYQIEIGNTGSAAATQMRILAMLPANVVLDRINGPESRCDGQRLVSVPLTLEPNSKVRWEITTKVTRKANVPFTVDVLAEQLSQPIRGGDHMPAQTGMVLPQLGTPPAPQMPALPPMPVQNAPAGPQLPVPELPANRK